MKNILPGTPEEFVQQSVTTERRPPKDDVSRFDLELPDASDMSSWIMDETAESNRQDPNYEPTDLSLMLSD